MFVWLWSHQGNSHEQLSNGLFWYETPQINERITVTRWEDVQFCCGLLMKIVSFHKANNVTVFCELILFTFIILLPSTKLLFSIMFFQIT